MPKKNQLKAQLSFTISKSNVEINYNTSSGTCVCFAKRIKECLKFNCGWDIKVQGPETK